MTKRVKKSPIIAIAQIRYFDIAKKNNVEKIKKYICLAKKNKADIICFPESCVHKTDVLYKNHGMINAIKAECKENSIWCIITEDLKIGKKKYNVSLLIDRDGKIRGYYKKIHLYGDEVYPGRNIKVFKTDFGKIGLAICWDLAFPELFKKLKEAGAQIIFCPAQWKYENRAYGRAYTEEHKKQEKELLESLIRTRAFENLYFVALCNPVLGNRKDQVSYSAICSPHKILKEIKEREGMIFSKINLNEINTFRKLYKNV